MPEGPGLWTNSACVRMPLLLVLITSEQVEAGPGFRVLLMQAVSQGGSGCGRAQRNASGVKRALLGSRDLGSRTGRTKRNQGGGDESAVRMVLAC